MKKPKQKCSEANTFKFQPFSERISNINVDVFHRVQHRFEDDSSEDGTYFYQCIQKWNTLNLSESYESFCKELPSVATLPQLLVEKDTVVSILVKHINKQDALCLQPLLESVVALARDLHSEFYSYYPQFLGLLIELLESKDTDQLDWTFSCLAYLFKFLWRCLVKDVDVVFSRLLPLLSNTKPYYVNNFAAESFAFVARKVKDKRRFLLLILKLLERDDTGISGCGHLLFEVLHGVSGQFHSSAEDVLMVYLRSLKDESFPQEILFTVFSNVFQAMVSKMKPKNIKIFWKCFLCTAKEFLNFGEAANSWKHLEYLLKLAYQIIEYKSGVFVCDPASVAENLADSFTCDSLPEKIISLATDAVAVILTSPYTSLPQHRASHILLTILHTSHVNVFRSFVEKLFDYSTFESIVLPRFLEHVYSSFSNMTDSGDKEILNLLTKLVLHKAPLCSSGNDLTSWKPLLIDFSRFEKNSSEFKPSSMFLELLNVKNISTLSGNQDLLCALICLPHIRPLDMGLVKESLKQLLTKMSDFLLVAVKNDVLHREDTPEPVTPSKRNWEKSVKEFLFLYSVALETTVHILDSEEIDEVIDMESVIATLLPFATNVNYLSSLRSLDLYLTAISMYKMKKLHSSELAARLFDKLKRNLSSPYSKVRSLTLHIFSLFEHDSDDDSVLTNWTLFSTALSAESLPINIHDYREKLNVLQNLKYDSCVIALVSNPIYSEAPLYYLFGALFINFQLLWDPVIQLVASYAHGLPPRDFWPIFKEQLEMAAKFARTVSDDSDKSEADTAENLLASLQAMDDCDDRADYTNYRMLLWKAMNEFPDVCEARNRDIVSLFLSFISEEYMRNNSEFAYSWNIKQIDPKEDSNIEGEEKTNSDSEFTAVKELKKSVTLTAKFSSKSSSKTLLAHMAIFTKIKSPMSMYREQELIKVYYEFLMHKNPAVQTMALNCILTYKQKGVLPYQEHLHNLIDNKKFKSELTLFRVDKESTVVQEEHRAEVMPIVLRILHSKMFSKTGLKTGGKGGGRLRRSLVLRFLAGCHEEEMKTFVEMAFKIYSKYLKDDPLQLVESVFNIVNLEQVIPPKRLQSSLNLVMVIIEQFGSLMGDCLLQYVLRVLLCIGSTVTAILMKRENVHPGYLPMLRNLRTSCLECLARFFEHFEEYSWTNQEVDAVFQVFIWPWLENLPVEGIHSPTALLKLFSVWSNHPRYFILFAKHALGDTLKTPLPYILKLLCGPKTHPSVTSMIMEILEHLLTLQDSKEESENVPVIEVQPVLPVTDAASGLSLFDLNYGSCLLLPHVNTILEHLQQKLSATKRGGGLGREHLTVLSRITELAHDSSSSDTLVQVLLPVLMKKSGAGEEVITDMLASLNNLIGKVDHPETYIRSIAPLFSTISFPGPRKLLCSVLKSIANHCKSDQREKVLISADIINELNAWNARWVEQPDFDKRLDAFKKIHSMLEQNEIDVDFASIIIHTCFHFLKAETDMSLRDSAGFCLLKLSPVLCIKYRDNSEDREFLINDTIFRLVCAGIKDKNESVQYQSISLLGVMARECGDLHPVLRDLSKLSNKADLEVDFFENIQHLQAHRKTRALLRFCNISKELTKPPSPRTLTQFILPLATSFLCNIKHSGKNSVVDAAIEVLGVTCRLLPWHQYQMVLIFYLNKLRQSLEFQKQLVRIIVAILDAFHFNLSRAELVTESVSNMEVVSNVEAGANDAVDAGITETKNAENEYQEKLVEHEDLVEILDKEVQDDKVDIDEEIIQKADEILVPAVSRQTTLARSAAGRVITTIRTILLPQLHRSIIRRTKNDTLHKVNKKMAGSEQDEEDMLRVPIALAIVKLLQKLPKTVLDQNLPGIFMKLCNFLKSRLESVRRVTRETLQKIIVSLGPSYLPVLLREMLALLTKGYQVHVLVYTVHSVMIALKGHFKRGDVDACLHSVLEACRMDLFGVVSEEKEVSQITGKLKEARSTKSYDTFNILAQHISDKCFTDLLLPLKQVLAKNFSHKVIVKVSDCLRQIVFGLVENKFVSVESLLIFSYGTSSESIPELITVEKKMELTPAEQDKLSRQKPDSFIIPSAPRSRYGTLNITAKTSSRTNAHILVEFGLQLFYTLLKKEKLNSEDCRPFIDPMVPILCNCFDAQHTKLTTLAVHCLTWILKMELPSVKSNINKISTSLFNILHKFAVANLGKGENFSLVVATFKAVTVLVRNVKYHTISADQLKVLLLYAEQDIHDFSRQATAFSLLKAILARKLQAPEMEDVMKKVAKLSITSERSNVRLQARQVFHQFLMDYPLGKKIEGHLAFYITQLNYELQYGRVSALEMLHSIIESFPLAVLEEHSGLLFLTLGVRLVNDDVPECKKMVAQCIKLMLNRLENNARDKLFDILLIWFSDKKVEHRQLAAHLCGIFVQLEKCDFEVRFSQLLPLLSEQFSGRNESHNEQGRYVRIAQVNETTEAEEKAFDHLLFVVLQTYVKICQHCPSFLKHENWLDYVESLLDICQYYLSHDHEWVRLAAAQIIGYIFSSTDPYEVAQSTVLTSVDSCSNLVKHVALSLKTLTLDLCAMLQPGEILPELLEQVIKNLVFIGRIVKDIREKTDIVRDRKEVEDEEEGLKVSLPWLIRRMRKIINMEIVRTPKSTHLRMAVFKWIGAMVMNLDSVQLSSCIHALLAPLVREMASEGEEFAELRRLSKEVSNIIKKKIGMDKYTQHVSRVQLQIASRKAERKKLRIQEAVTDQEKAAKRKIKKQLKKKTEKKKKLEILKGRKPGKRKMKKDVEIVEDM